MQRLWDNGQSLDICYWEVTASGRGECDEGYLYRIFNYHLHFVMSMHMGPW